MPSLFPKLLPYFHHRLGERASELFLSEHLGIRCDATGLYVTLLYNSELVPSEALLYVSTRMIGAGDIPP